MTVILPNGSNTTTNFRANLRCEDNQPSQAKRIGKLHERMAKMREEIEQIRTDPTLDVTTRSILIRELTESIHAAELEVEVLKVELAELEQEENGSNSLTNRRNRDSYDYSEPVESEVYTIEQVMPQFAENIEENEDSDEETAVNSGAVYNTGAIDDIAAAYSDIETAETVMAATDKLERDMSRKIAHFISSGGEANKKDIMKMREQIKENRANPLKGLLKK
jgi:hypothetical protein